MDIAKLFNMQGTIIILILVGFFLKKKEIISSDGRKGLTDLCLNVIIPCNIIRSFLIKFDMNILKNCGLLLILGIIIESICLLLNKFFYNNYEEKQKKVMQYCTIVSMGGFLGNPIVEGVYGEMGLLYASIFLIPMRIIMWSIGPTYFVQKKMEVKSFIKNVLTHPCLVAVYIGVLIMISQITLPQVILLPINYISSCNSAIIMFIIGMILSDTEILTIFNKDTIKLSTLRLIFLPLLVLILSYLLRTDRISTGVAVLITGMPAGTTAAIFADKYESDPSFATKCVVATTMFSMITLPTWIYLIG